MSVAACICTHRRPAGLRALLQALPGQTRVPDLVCVVDNHPDAEGLRAIEALRDDDYPLPLHSEAVTEGGISAARNAVLALALSHGATRLALIDDDETPEPDWLAELLRVQRETAAGAVGGPTRPRFAAQTPAELRSAPYYGADLGLPDGSTCTLQACGNALLTAESLSRLERPWFDPRLGHSGGEDLAFFMALSQAGVAMHWAALAAVSEAVPAHRANRPWLRERARLIANSRVFVTAERQPQLAAAALRAAKTAALGAQALLMSALAPLRGARGALDAELLRAKFDGKWQAHLGRRLQRSEGH